MSYITPATMHILLLRTIYSSHFLAHREHVELLQVQSLLTSWINRSDLAAWFLFLTALAKELYELGPPIGYQIKWSLTRPGLRVHVCAKIQQ